MNEYRKYITYKVKQKILKIFWKIISEFYFSKQNPNIYKIIKLNRDYLKDSGSLISKDEYDLIDYGIPKKNFKFINEPLTNKLTNLDLIVYLLKSNKNININYLEIGTSVLKNFMVVNNSFNNFNLVAYDINPITQKHKDKFNQGNEKASKLYKSKNLNNSLYYFHGDVLSEEDTNNFNDLLNFKYDFIYSDALHTKKAVESEFKNLVKNNLNSKFIIYYDDLDIKLTVPAVEPAVLNIFEELKEQFSDLNLYTFWIYGWIGEYENMHKNAIITNINLDEELIDNLKLPFLKKF